MELIMKTDLAKVMPKQIEFNYAPLKTELAEKLSYYKNLVVTEDSIKSAKDDRAMLRKLKDTLNAKKVSVKKDFLIPYEEFEREVKELMSMIDEPIFAIDSQVKSFEEQQKAEKKAKIDGFYDELIGELSTLLPLEKIFNSKWLNTATSPKSIKTELTETISKVKSDIDIIKEMHIECEQTMLDAYLRTLSMSDALAEKNRYEAQQDALKEYERKQAEQKAKDVEPVADEIPTACKTIAEPSAPDYWNTFPESEPAPVETVHDVKMIFYATTAKFRAAMKSLTEEYGIDYDGLN